MKIRIAKNWWEHYVRGQYGKTQAEKESSAECIFMGPGKRWADSMNKYRGKWVTVETEHLFSDQFNVVEGNLRVNAKHIDGIDFGPEFKDLDAFREAVQTRYDKDWPGRKVQCRVITSYIKSGFITIHYPRFSFAQMVEICKPLGITVIEPWSHGYCITAKDETALKLLEEKGFDVSGIGIGYDYNLHCITVYAKRRKQNG